MNTWWSAYLNTWWSAENSLNKARYLNLYNVGKNK